MDYLKLALIILGVLFVASGILGVIGVAPVILVYSMIFFGFAFLIIFRILWIKWQAKKIGSTFKKSKIQGYIYLIILLGLTIVSIIYKIYFK